jgi:curved DNA-binding protein CbpA
MRVETWFICCIALEFRYIRLAKETHPDTGGDAVIFQDVLLAYRILSDEERRKAFDDTGSDSGDSTEEERKVRLPDLQTLRSAVENHRRFGHFVPSQCPLCALHRLGADM